LSEDTFFNYMGFVASNGMNDELERMWKVVVACTVPALECRY
jgi:hypothetical protein